MQAAATLSCSALSAVPKGLGSRRFSAATRLSQQQQRRQLVAGRALGDSSNKGRGTLKREDEPEEYWTSKAERDGKSPFQDPLAQIGLLAIFFPFIFLALAIAFGWVDLSGGRS